mgnify:CR=1 FL=1
MPKGRGNQVLKDHKRGEDVRAFCVYTVYDNRTDLPVIIDGDAKAAAAAMGLKLGCFYAAVVNARTGRVKRWHIEKRFLDGK